MNRDRRHLTVIASLAVILVCVAVLGRAATHSRPPTPPPVAATQRVGTTPASREITFSVSLDRGPGRRQALDRFLADLADPTAPSYRRFIDAATFGRRFGAPESRIERVTAWLEQHGMQVSPPPPQRTALEVRAPAATVASAFRVRLADYRDRAGHAWHEPEAAARIPTSLAGEIAGVAGLSTRPSFSNAEAGAPANGYDAKALARAYGIADMWNRGFHGENQGIAIINYAPYRQADIDAFDKATGATGLPPVTLVKFGPGASSDDPTDSEEPALDIEVIRGLAPQAKIYEYEAPNRGGLDALIVNQIVADGLAKTISLSWGSCDRAGAHEAEAAALDTALQAAAAAGINMVVASGDDGAYDCYSRRLPDDVRSQPEVDFPACTTWPIAVGGTRLALDEQGNVLEETGWEGWMRTSGGGGGPSRHVPRPAHQVLALRIDANGHRQCPDVAAVADSSTGYQVWLAGKNGPTVSGTGGTSGAAPLWAAAIALMQQQAASVGTSLGYLPPQLYRAALDRSPGLVDVTRGGNLLHDAGPGYDYSTGLGTPRVAALADYLVANRAP